MRGESLSVLSQDEWQVCKVRRLAVESERSSSVRLFRYVYGREGAILAPTSQYLSSVVLWMEGKSPISVQGKDHSET